jgi:xylose isomerase
MAASAEFFPAIKPVKYDPKADLSNLLVFRHYNADEVRLIEHTVLFCRPLLTLPFLTQILNFSRALSQVVLGKSMAEWCRFAVCYWHTFRYTGADPFGPGTMTRVWEDGTNSMACARQRMRAAFELMSKV